MPVNPSKHDIGKVSKAILDKINQDLQNILQLNQWEN